MTAASGECIVASYLIKTFDTRGRLVGRFEFAAPNDAEAEGAAGDFLEQRTQELWCGRRWLRTWVAPRKATA